MQINNHDFLFPLAASASPKGGYIRTYMENLNLAREKFAFYLKNGVVFFMRQNFSTSSTAIHIAKKAQSINKL